MHLSPCSLYVAAGLLHLAHAGYTIEDDYMNDFFNQWDFFTGDDPTHGYVNYVDSNTANNNGYIRKNDDNSIYIGVDHQNVASGRGRDSVRISTKKTYDQMLTVVDIGHMPGGICGTWPAFWSFGNGGRGWPYNGEIDIIEGANDQRSNHMTLHSDEGCSISSFSKSKLQSASQDCNSFVNGNQGCSFHDDSDSTSFGSGFNANGGGIYATEWSSTGVSIWFFPRGSEPGDVLGNNPNPSNWGEPSAFWGGDSCDWDAKFNDHNLIFDTTFCGDWADNTFSSCSASNGGQTCQQFVQNNPQAFQDAYWQVNALKVYSSDGQSSDVEPPFGQPISDIISVIVPEPTEISISIPSLDIGITAVIPEPTTFAVSTSRLALGVGSGGQVQEAAPDQPSPVSVPSKPTPVGNPLGTDENGGVGESGGNSDSPLGTDENGGVGSPLGGSFHETKEEDSSEPASPAEIPTPEPPTPAVASSPAPTPLATDSDGAVGGSFHEDNVNSESEPSEATTTTTTTTIVITVPTAEPTVPSVVLTGPASAPEVVDESASGQVYDPAPKYDQNIYPVDNVEIDASGKVYDEVGIGRRAASTRREKRRLEHFHKHGKRDGVRARRL